ncbi:MAG: sulfatase-like hydrolase/transferase [Candidatus Marinimicrobia bacterium]|nr:sulfatase-like hydrolase/transferase [Candidatus Neomarinimicrobiota bacterium]MBT6130144.1 sulfatase-like hydrolase/transferase [Candidatus Neomarinimicrobiota bacterium]
MNLKIINSIFLLGLFWVSSCAKETPPNIVLIFTDDQGYADVGIYGAKGYKTPNLDQMAAEGMRFTDFHVSQAVCSASRAALLTGCYSERVSVQGAYNHTSRAGLNPDEETIAEILKKEGYATGIFGKWHLGHHEKFLPLQQGFDEYLGLPYSNDMWPVHYDGTSLINAKHTKSFYPVLPLIEDNKKIGEIRTLEDQGTLTTRYTERAVSFIKKNKDNPFFLYLPHSMPHVPLGVSDKFKGKSEQGMYGDVMMEIDWSVGEILKALKDNGLDENTLVVFTSDNGPWMNYGKHAGSALPLREGKGAMWEGGARVPAIMRWPGKIPQGIISDQLAATIDILPTIADITGADLPEKKIDGLSFKSHLLGNSDKTPRNNYNYYYAGELVAVRQGKWKLTFPHEYRSYLGVEPGKDGFPGKYAKGKAGIELYNLENDISESNNVANQHPDIVSRLKAFGQNTRQELGDRLTQTKGNGVRPPGRLDPERPPEERNVKHKGIGKNITIKNAFSTRYTAGGKNATIDGLRGSLNFRDEIWQGYQSVDFEAILDLGKMMPINEVSISFLQNQSSWIFFPKEVKIEISKNGQSFEVIKNELLSTEISLSHEIKEILVSNSSLVKFIKVTAKNVSICPEWHPGSGGKAWLFLDEIVVK